MSKMLFEVLQTGHKLTSLLQDSIRGCKSSIKQFGPKQMHAFQAEHATRRPFQLAKQTGKDPIHLDPFHPNMYQCTVSASP